MRYPAYYTRFACFADHCRHSCCRGWEIDIDPESLAFYREHGGNLSGRLASGIAEDEEGGHFILTEDERCPFLNQNGLCDIYTTLGKDALCQICTEHPRYYSSFGDTDYAGVGLCCEAAAALILSPETDLTLTGEEQSPLAGKEASLYTDWLSLLEYAGSLSDRFIGSDFFCSAESLRLIRFLLGLEINDSSWSELLQETILYFKDITLDRKAFLNSVPEVQEQYRRLTHYFLYRHVPNALSYEDLSEGISAKVNFSLLSVEVIRILDSLQWIKNRKFSMEDAINTARLFSEEIEYCEENTRALEEYGRQFKFI